MHELGIHIGLSANEYFKDEGLGSTDQKALARDPIDWQYDRRRPQPGDDEDTAATLWGHALHCRLLEGEKIFREQYILAPKKEDFTGLLDTVADLKAHADRIRATIKSAMKKEEIIRVIRTRDKTVPIWAEIIADLQRQAEGKHIIEREIADKIDTAAQWMQTDAFLGEYMANGTFTAGVSELSIFVEIDGVRVRMRIDHLLPDAMMDVKSFRPLPGWNSIPEEQDRVLGRILRFEKYTYQAASYMHTWTHARKLFDAGKVFGGTERDHKIIEAAFKTDALKWLWVMVKNQSAPQTFVRGLNVLGAPFKTAMEEILLGLDIYRANRELFGMNRDWIPQHAAGVIDDEVL